MILMLFLLMGFAFITCSQDMLHVHWAIDGADPADYVYLAQNFWKIPHASNDLPDFIMFQRFLSIFPFRQIGVGSFYLFWDYISGGHALEYGPVFVTFLLAVSYAIFAYTCNRKFGLGTAIVCFIILITTTNGHNSGRELLTEPFLRILFILCLALSLTLCSKRTVDSIRPVMGLWILCLLMVQIKIQWLLLGLLLLAFYAAHLFLWKKWKHLLLVAVIAAFLPLSILYVNWKGWHYPGLIVGNSLHTMFKNPKFLSSSCKEKSVLELSPRYCNEKRFRFRSWGEFIGYQYPDQDIKKLILALDKYSLKIQNFNLDNILRNFLTSSVRYSNFPHVKKNCKKLYLIKRFVDTVSFILCFSGLFIASLRFSSFLCLSLWGVPLFMNQFAMWNMRYSSPMAGLIIIVAFLVLRHWFYQLRWQETIKLVGSKQLGLTKKNG